MFGSRVRSALFIDFENVGRYCEPEKLRNWLAWIEDGEFDDEHQRRRKLVEKRIYWNSSHQRYEDVFRDQGFEIVLCEKLSYLKNGADIRIALDVMESLTRRQNIVDEFILLAQDTDYVPVLQRLGERKRRSAILVDEKQERVFTTYDLHADTIIPLRIFLEDALNYEPRRSFRQSIKVFATQFGRKADNSAAAPATIEPPGLSEQSVESTAKGEAVAPRVPRQQERRAELGPVGMAERAVIRVTSRKPGEYTARGEIERELNKIQGFTRHGPNKYFHLGSYELLMQQVAKRSSRIKIDPATHGKISVKYVADDDA